MFTRRISMKHGIYVSKKDMKIPQFKNFLDRSKVIEKRYVNQVNVQVTDNR